MAKVLRLMSEVLNLGAGGELGHTYDCNEQGGRCNYGPADDCADGEIAM